jgi:metal-responsive CopG/Arc/MetJ family transcriptional regulator
LRTSVVIPDPLFEEVKRVIGDDSLSSFVREALLFRLEELRRKELEEEMEAGYRAEAADLSLDPEWADIETEGL